MNIDAILMAIILVFGSLFLVLSVASFIRVRSKIFIFAIILFSMFLLKPIIYFISIFGAINLPLYLYALIDVLILFILYMLIVKR
ncbi:MAG: hypothetical protein QXH07_04400 [Thermoplasmata archaeon]